MTSCASGSLDFLQLLKFRFAFVIFIQRIATADDSVAWRCRAIAESPANKFRCQFATRNRISENGRITQNHSPDSHHVRPPISDYGLRNMWQIFLQITVTGTDEY